ncbi:Gag-pro-like protein [Cucumis melo var. makuwa]|uniref:Gag-pro-like protein n=1 Tax=Cucumis melo var. makuwa TaxID=1194695 RepID=A0A5D3C1I2_CUCMM|nr:Gag-pro-like protein [Cucumis melo var. makuwa]
MSYTELLPQLLKSHQVAIVPQEPLQPPYPKWYDLNAKCEYHAGAVGHSTENCFPLKAKVQSPVKAGWLKFKKTGEESDVNQNPLPNHEGPTINAVDMFMQRHKNRVSDVTTSMKTLFQILHGVGYLSPRFNNNDREKIECTNKEQCLLHLEINDHSIEDCCEFRNEVQKLMDAKILLIGQMSKQEIEVNMITNASSNEKTSNKTTSMWKPLVIHYEEKPSIMSYMQKPKTMTVEIPGPFAYKDNHAIPWKYECQFITDNVVSATVGGITRSGRAHVEYDILVDAFSEIVENITATNCISFIDEEIPSEGTGHTKALHISVKCKDHHVARVLVDNGSSLNIISRSTLMKLPIDPPYLRPSTMVVRAFDGARREDDLGFIQQGQSHLHKRLKFSVKGGQAIVYGEEDMFVTKTSVLPYVEATEEALEYISNDSKKMIKSGFQMHKGLGKDNQGDSEVIFLPKAKEKFGLGYKPAAFEWEKVRAKKKEKRSALLVGREMKEESISIPNLSETFKPRELLFDTNQRKRRNKDSEISIAVVSENTILPHPLVHQCPPEFELNNWEIKKTLEVTKGL